MIGDANPHPPDYKLNVDNIDWREEVAVIAKKVSKVIVVVLRCIDSVLVILG